MFYKNLLNFFSSGPYLAQFSRQRLKLTNLSNQQAWENDPLVALDDSVKGKPIIVAIGAMAKGKTNLVVNPFGHPRVFISDFTAAEALLKHALRELMPRHFLKVSPKLILHVPAINAALRQIKAEGGFARACREAFAAFPKLPEQCKTH